MRNKTARMIEKAIKKEKKPLHLVEISQLIKKTREACYTAIHLEEGKTFEKTKPATYGLIKNG